MKPYERFLKYVAFPTMSDESSETVPSTEKQIVLSMALAAELISLGLEDVELDEKGYLYATLPANTDKPCPTIGLVAHVDTSDACADAPIAARIVEYQGGDICL
ncbi:MAG: peptidase T, partial [Clostridia bacterium]|nr:peptidase T [Clostridia bacterium]